MPRQVGLMALLVFVADINTARSEPPGGSWKLTLPTQTPITILLAVSQAEGKWVADVIDITPKRRKEPKTKDVAFTADTLRFTIVMDDVNSIQFEGIVAKGAKTIKGSMAFTGGSPHTLELQPSTLKSLADPFDVAKEGLTQTEDAEVAFENALVVLRQAAAKKMAVEDSRAIVDAVGKLAVAHGRRWDRHVTLKLAETLAAQDGHAEVALAQARKAERMLDDADELSVRMATLEALMKSLTAAKKPDEAKTYQAQIAKLEAREWADFTKGNPAFPVEEFKGRKGKSDRVVLVEAISGLNYDASAAIDAATAAVLKAYKPAEVLVLTYHLPLDAKPDLLTVREGFDRMTLYREHVTRGRHGLVAGKPSVGLKGETTVADGKTIYETLRDRINEELETPAKVKLALTIAPGGKPSEFTAKASVSELEKPGDGMTVRFALVEERTRLNGGNGTKFHQMVVRAMPGGAKGVPLKGAAAEVPVTFALDAVKADIVKFIDEMSEPGEPVSDRVTTLKNLKLIAFVQNDTTGDILTAASADVK